MIIDKDALKYRKAEFIDRVLKGDVFIHPTDTIYGIGCDATNGESIDKVREIKKRPGEKPFSVIAPSKQWIMDNFEFDDKVIEWVAKLPGPYTLILKIKNKDAISPVVNNGGDTLGVRIPDHWISKAVAEVGVPITTTSVNFRGEDYMTSIDDLNPEIRSKVGFIVYEDEKVAQPSTIVNLAGTTVEAMGYRKVI